MRLREQLRGQKENPKHASIFGGLLHALACGKDWRIKS
jgi:hypothetical protein